MLRALAVAARRDRPLARLLAGATRDFRTRGAHAEYLEDVKASVGGRAAPKASRISVIPRRAVERSK